MRASAARRLVLLVWASAHLRLLCFVVLLLERLPDRSRDLFLDPDLDRDLLRRSRDPERLRRLRSRERLRDRRLRSRDLDLLRSRLLDLDRCLLRAIFRSYNRYES